MGVLRMLIEETFRLQDGRTVFLGQVENGPDYISTIACVLEVDGEVVQELVIEGEMLPEKRTPDERRVLSTTDEIAIDRDRLSGAVLRCVEAGPSSGCRL